MVLAVAVSLAESFLLYIGKHTRGLTIASVFVALLLGIAASHIRNPLTNESHFSRHLTTGYENDMLVVLADDLQPTPKHLKSTAHVCALRQPDGLLKTSGKTLLYFDTSADGLTKGSRLLVRGRLLQVPDSLGEKGFNYKRYLERKGVFFQCFVDHYQLVGQSNPSLPSRWRNRLDLVVDRSDLTEENRGIVKAMFLGDKRAPLDLTKDDFRKAGVSHLLCVSGLHVGIVAALVAFLLIPLGRGRRASLVRAAIELAVVWLFVLMTGASPSTLRAGVMFSFIIAARAYTMHTPGLNALAASALVLMIYRPSLVMDVGFQLSYSAVAGIMIFSPPLCRFSLPIKRNTVRSSGNHKLAKLSTSLLKRLWQYTAVCLSAQLFTMPLVLYYFGYISPWFLIANLLIVPFAGLLLGSMMLLVAVSGWPWAWSLMQIIVNWELSVVCAITHWVATL